MLGIFESNELQMNKIILTLIISLVTFCSYSQDFEKVRVALENGNVTELSSMLDATIDLTIDDKDYNIGRGEADNKLRSFFVDHQPRSVKLIHKGVSKNGVHYMIGELNASTGFYRVTVYMHEAAGQFLIQSLELEKE